MRVSSGVCFLFVYSSFHKVAVEWRMIDVRNAVAYTPTGSAEY